jgi:hypothetical protein
MMSGAIQAQSYRNRRIESRLMTTVAVAGAVVSEIPPQEVEIGTSNYRTMYLASELL